MNKKTPKNPESENVAAQTTTPKAVTKTKKSGIMDNIFRKVIPEILQKSWEDLKPWVTEQVVKGTKAVATAVIVGVLGLAGLQGASSFATAEQTPAAQTSIKSTIPIQSYAIEGRQWLIADGYHPLPENFETLLQEQNSKVALAIQSARTANLEIQKAILTGAGVPEATLASKIATEKAEKIIAETEVAYNTAGNSNYKTSGLMQDLKDKVQDTFKVKQNYVFANLSFN